MLSDDDDEIFLFEVDGAVPSGVGESDSPDCIADFAKIGCRGSNGIPDSPDETQADSSSNEKASERKVTRNWWRETEEWRQKYRENKEKGLDGPYNTPLLMPHLCDADESVTEGLSSDPYKEGNFEDIDNTAASAGAYDNKEGSKINVDKLRMFMDMDVRFASRQAQNSANNHIAELENGADGVETAGDGRNCGDRRNCGDSHPLFCGEAYGNFELPPSQPNDRVDNLESKGKNVCMPSCCTPWF